MDIISVINLANIQESFNAASFRSNWPHYKEYVIDLMGNAPTRDDILDIGNSLSSMFTLDTTGRSQSNVSSAGSAWARLACWYLNVCLIGTRGFAVNNSALMPKAVQKALKLKFNGSPVPRSNEIVVIEYAGDATSSVRLPSGVRIDYRNVYNDDIYRFLDNLNERELRVTLVAAKTNCSDMVSIPLFWSFCYKGNLQNVFNIKVGSNEHHPENFIDGRVKYSIVTVPTGRESQITNGNLPGATTLNKLSLLDGGFYWGRPSDDRVNSFKYFIDHNLPMSCNYAGTTVAAAYNRILSGDSPLATIFGD